MNPLFPLITQQLNKTDCLAIVQTVGIDVPAMYKLGYPNNNCIGCVKGGKGYWNKIRTDFPTTFERMSELERYVGRSCINGTFLDELDPVAGRNKTINMPDCGSLCDIKYGEIIHKKTTILNVTVKHINGCTDTFVCDTRWFGDYEMLNGKRIWLVDDMVVEGSL